MSKYRVEYIGPRNTKYKHPDKFTQVVLTDVDTGIVHHFTGFDSKLKAREFISKSNKDKTAA